MKILFINWKDYTNPIAGGAEVVADELCKKMVEDGHEVTYLTANYSGAKSQETLHGYSVIRVGNGKFTQAFAGLWYYIRNLKNKHDIIIDTVNTAPYFIGFFRGKAKYFLFYHQLAEEVWEYETKLPLSLVGRYILEPVATYLNGLLSVDTITISESTKANLVEYGFKPSRIKIIREGIGNIPLNRYNPAKKSSEFTVLFFSSLRQMKRPDEAIKSFALFSKNTPDCALWLAGGGNMRSECELLAESLGIAKQVRFYGRVSDEKKLKLMQEASIFISTSIKEGWGLIVSEANSMATPALCYDVDGLRDAATQGQGKIVTPNPEAMSVELQVVYNQFTDERHTYNKWCETVLKKSREINFDNAYSDLKKIIFK